MNFFNFRTFLPLVLFLSTFVLVFTACNKEEILKDTATPTELEHEEEVMPFSKEIRVYDDSRENYVILQVAAHDKTLVDNYSSRSFKLIPLYEKPEINEANNADGNSEPASPTDDTYSEVQIITLEKHLTPNVIGFTLDCENVEGSNRSPIWKSHYTKEDCVKVNPFFGVNLIELKYYKRRSRVRGYEKRRHYTNVSSVTSFCYSGYMIKASVLVDRNNEWYNHYRVTYWDN